MSVTMDAIECGAMHGVKVVDFGQYIAGPLVARMLADEGASVTHVDPPTGPAWKSRANACLNRRKQCVRLDLKSSDGVASALDLIRSADVVVSNFRPGVMERLGLGGDKCKEINPQVIYITMPGFASTDEEYRDIRAFEAIIIASSGAFSDMGLNRVLRGVNPSFSPLCQASIYSAVIGTIAVSLALYNRDRNGLGDVIEVPLASGLMDCLVYNSLDMGGMPPRYKCLRELEVERRQEKNMRMNLSYDAIHHMLDPFYSTYWCQDGRPFYVVAPCHAIHQERVLKALGIWDELVAAGLPQGDTYLHSDEWKDNCVLGTYPISNPKWMTLIKERMKEAFKKQPAATWDQIFGGMKIPGAKTLETAEFVQTEHAQSSELIIRVEDPTYGSMLQPGPSSWLCRARVPSTSAQREAARAIGMDSASRASTTQAWLHGVKVVDLCNVIAGPYAGGVLARFGANVVKVDPNDPTYDGLVAVMMGVPPNRSKRSLLADLKCATGRDILRRLVKWADVVLVNQVPSQLVALGCDEASLKKINPQVILGHFSAWGGPGWGPKSDHIGYDDLLQAGTGIMARFGGGLKSPEEHAHLGTIDVVSGFSFALSVIYALIKRRRTGQSDVAQSSLAANGIVIQTQFMMHYDGMPATDEARGAEALGEHALYHWYKGSCGEYFFLAMREEERAAAYKGIEAALGVAGANLAGKSDGEVKAFLADAFGKKSVKDICRALKDAGITVMERHTMEGRRKANVVDKLEFGRGGGTFQFTRQTDHPIGGEVTIFAPCSIRSSKVAIPVGTPQPRYGQHSREVLAELGYDERSVEAFIQAGTVRESWSKDAVNKYLPGGDPWAKQVNELDAYLGVAARL